MSAAEQQPITYRRLRAPRANGELLVDPPLSEAASRVAANRERFTSVQCDFGGESFASLRQAARQFLISAARSYTSQYREVVGSEGSAEGPIVLAGHQPELFHPGVWFKNIVLSEIGKQLRAPAVNLIIDADTLAAPAVRVLGGRPIEPRVTTVAFDQPAEVIPFEQRYIVDQALFASFPQRVKRAADGMWPGSSLLRQLWPAAVKAVQSGRPLGEALAQARHCYEAHWNLQTYELPLSHVAQSEAFRRFMLQLLTNLPRFVEVYNLALAEYRAVHKLRSRSHPAPDLEQADGLLEAPFWIWSDDEPRRGRLHLRRTEAGLELLDPAVANRVITLPLEANYSAALATLAEAEEAGLKLRPRALITTMFARLILSDLFLHGIGGSKYDQLTDALIRRYFGAEPPSYLTVSATVYPPVEVPAVEPSDLTRLAQRQRELEYHPEAFLRAEQRAEAVEHVEAKQHAISAGGDSMSATARHRAIVSANEALQAFIAPQYDALQRETDELERLLLRNRRIYVREWPFVLFSDKYLRTRLLDQIVDTA